MPFAPAFDRRDSIYYECHGSGPHKVLFLMGILTPGAPACPARPALPRRQPHALIRAAVPGNDWELQTEHFSSQPGEFTCCTIDNRGSGQSSTPRGLLTTHEMALDAASVLTYLGWTENVHVISISMVGSPPSVSNPARLTLSFSRARAAARAA